jgi:hypothetical protein
MLGRAADRLIRGNNVKRARRNGSRVCYKRGVPGRQGQGVKAWNEWDGTRAEESLGVRIIRRTAIVWVPVVGIGAAVGIKAVAGLLIRIVFAVFTWILRVLFH